MHRLIDRDMRFSVLPGFATLRPVRASYAIACAALLASLSGASHARPEPEAPKDGAGWLHVRAGTTLADAATLDGLTLNLEAADTPTLVFGLGAHWRTTGFDFGLIFEQLSAWSFDGLERSNRAGAQFRASAELRWRYLEANWGGMYIALNPGLAVLDHADPLRFQVSQINGSPLDSVSQHSLGFAFGFGFGALIYASRDLAISVDLEVISTTSALATAGGEVDLDMVRAVFAAGLEWELP
jgi:opacity protein-like surface antigen